MNADTGEEPPLDPVLENVRRKLVRRMAWSLGIMMIGLMAILGAIVYKIGFQDTGNRLIGSDEVYSVAIPPGSVVEDTSMDADRLLIRIRLDSGEQQLVVIDLKTGDVLSTIGLDEKP